MANTFEGARLKIYKQFEISVAKGEDSQVRLTARGAPYYMLFYFNSPARCATEEAALCIGEQMKDAWLKEQPTLTYDSTRYFDYGPTLGGPGICITFIRGRQKLKSKSARSTQ